MSKIRNTFILGLVTIGVVAILVACGSGTSDIGEDTVSNSPTATANEVEDEGSTDGDIGTMKLNSLKGVEFEADTISGDTFSSTEFSQYDLTMVNVWATWCGPCISELAGLQDVADQAPEGVNVITICIDSTTDLDAAKEISQAKGLTAPALIPNDILNEKILVNISAIPTTLFYNSDGDIVGSTVVGAKSTDLYLGEIDSHLELVGK